MSRGGSEGFWFDQVICHLTVKQYGIHVLPFDPPHQLMPVSDLHYRCATTKT